MKLSCADHHVVRGISALALAALAAPALAGTPIHVDADAPPGGDGLTWATAYDDLQEALAAAGPGDQVWVAAGTYAPAGPGGDRAASFQLVPGVALYGGFAGNEIDLPQRDPDANPTALSGDLEGNDGPGFTNYADNSWHVVNASGADPTAVLDGFTIRGGHANGDGDAACFDGPDHGEPCDGGGCPDGTCVSVNATGGGLLALSGSPTITNCRFLDNLAEFQGGAIMLKFGSDAAFAGCTFSGNRAGDNGGAMYLGLSAPTLIDCEFTANAGGNYAGASCNRDGSDALFVSCQFVGNTAAETEETGGGAIVNASSSPTFIGCLFTANVSFAGNGGAVYSKRGFEPGQAPSEPAFEDCQFLDNEAGNFGGAVYNIEGSLPDLDGCVLEGNTAVRGGAVYSAEASHPGLSDCTLSGHVAFQGGAMYQDTGMATLAGCTLDGNTSEFGPVANDGYGAGIYAVSATIVLSGGEIGGSMAGRYGAGVYAEGDSLISATGTSFSGNTAALGGGAVYVALDPLFLAEGCRFLGNMAQSEIFGGAAVFSVAATSDLRGCTFEGNASPDGMGTLMAFVDANQFEVTNGLFLDNAGGEVAIEGIPQTENHVSLTNCTILRPVPGVSVRNTHGDLVMTSCVLRNGLVSGNGVSSVTYSHVQFGYPGEGNITADPLFVDPAGGDYRLAGGSPCIDAGDSAAVPAAISTDFDGNPRFVDDPDTPDSGAGPAPVVDMGAWEWQGCPADLDGGGTVDVADLALLVFAWGDCPAEGPCPADLDGNGTVNVDDLIALILAWEDC